MKSDARKALYHDHAARVPIIDYHFLSRTCREYFRRILFGQMAEDGEYPVDMVHLGRMAENISCCSTLRCFRFDEILKEALIKCAFGASRIFSATISL